MSTGTRCKENALFVYFYYLVYQIDFFSVKMTYADVAITDLVFRLRDPEDMFKKFGNDQQRRELPEQ